MSLSDAGGPLTLDILASDSATEIFVVNGDLQLVDRGIGHLITKPLDPGIYKIKARVGIEAREQYVALSKPGQTLVLPQFTFASPAPLLSTSKTHEYHIEAASSESLNVHVNAGSGSAIFVFSREWTQFSDPSRQLPTRKNPAAGLWLIDGAGRTVANLGSAARVRSDVPDPFAACNVSVNPGMYRLAVDLPAGGRLEQTVVACMGWQTQVFLLQCDRDGGRCADLPNASLLMARGMGFQPNDGALRQTELARVGLANERKALAAKVRQMLGDKLDNPMLGIFGGHLLLLDASPDIDLLGTVVTDLRALVGRSHPDVEALALACVGTTHRFDTPPMLRRSWALVVDKTISERDLVPPDSLAATAATRLLSGEPWLVWTSGDASPDPRAAIERSIASALRLHIRPVQTPKWIPSAFAAIQKLRTQTPTAELSPPAPASPPLRSTPLPSPDDSKIGALVRTFGLPRWNVERMLNTTNIEEDDDGNA